MARIKGMLFKRTKAKTKIKTKTKEDGDNDKDKDNILFKRMIAMNFILPKRKKTMAEIEIIRMSRKTLRDGLAQKIIQKFIHLPWGQAISRR